MIPCVFGRGGFCVVHWQHCVIALPRRRFRASAWPALRREINAYRV